MVRLESLLGYGHGRRSSSVSLGLWGGDREETMSGTECLCPPDSYAEVLTPCTVIFGRGVLGK